MGRSSLKELNHMQVPATGADWLAVLEAWDVGTVVLDRRSDAGWVTLFRRQPAWQVDFEDEEVVIFVRAPSASLPSSPASSPRTSRRR